MYRVIVILLLFSVGLSSAQDFDLPEIINILVDTTAGSDFGADFCWVGDQDGDGYDDLLVNHNPWRQGEGDRYFHNRVELYRGGEEMDDEPDMMFTQDIEDFGFGWGIRYLGNITDNTPYVVMSGSVYNRRLRPVYSHYYFYSFNEEANDEPEFRMQRVHAELQYDGAFSVGNTLSFGPGYIGKPSDMNGDGNDDILIGHTVDENEIKLDLYFGGEEFDTIPDIQFDLPEIEQLMGAYNHTGGSDVNDDGFHDILVRYLYISNRDIRYYYCLYLGSDPPSGEIALEWNYNHYEGREMVAGFALLPDVNGDGYDDWGMHYMTENLRDDGYYIFFGGEEPDDEPDVELDGTQDVHPLEAYLVGGDFNQDGFGDVATSSRYGHHAQGEVAIYFGRRRMREEPDIDINGEEDYDLNYLGDIIGAIGDYNGDGTDDFVVRKPGSPKK